MKKYTMLEIVKMLKKSGSISGNDEMVLWINKIKKDKKIRDLILNSINPALVGSSNLSDKIIENLL